MKVIISGGGTGGHIYPAIAIADAIKSIDSQAEILFVGAEGRMEMEKVPKAGYRIEGLWISGIQRSFSINAIRQNLTFPFKLLHSLLKSNSILNTFKPDVVVGVGGYASGAILKAAQKKNIPTLIQEQNGYAGVTNKLLAKSAKKICVAYPQMEKYFPAEKIMFTGNPVRKDISNLNPLKEVAYQHFKLQTNKPTLLILGGSLGARTINESVAKSLEEWISKGVQVIWQTGKIYYSQYQSLAKESVIVLPFIERMDLAYSVADLVISRAGALSISELCLAAKPCILVPSPNVAEDHQTKNAMALVSQKAALMVKDIDAKEKLGILSLELINNEQDRLILSRNIATLAKPNAAIDIANEVLRIGKVKL
jgi:UDP-N-acetylglucosamine--N-acetylmuramyl-(pentapeptide) pyrophosphoryl-undecaprenol N-acetylglucosamine transferase